MTGREIFPARIGPRHGWLLAFFLLALLLVELGGRGLNDPDEGRYAEIAREALEPGHSWLAPHLAGLAHYDKPPLIYGVTALGFRLFGFHEWAARLPSFLGAVLALAGLGWAALRLHGERLAWLALLVAGTMLQFWMMARWLTPDMFLTGWCTLAVAAWAETRRAGGAWRWWTAQVLFWTLALWTKATPALVPLLGLALYVYLAGGPEARRALKLPLLLPAILVLSCPWFLWAMHRHPELKDFFLHRETVGRLTGGIAGRQEPFYFYLLTSLVAWLPWWPLALVTLLRQRARLPGLWARRILYPELFILAVGLVIFSAVPSKLQTYTLPLAPWAALTMARVLLADESFRKSPIVPVLAGATALVYLVAAVCAPNQQDDWGSDSSVRPVTQFLQSHAAVGIHSDRFWAGLDYYWGPDVHFTGVAPQVEINEPPAAVAAHFESRLPAALPPGAWFIHYRNEAKTPFRPWLDDPRVPKTTLGDFVVGPLN